MRRVSPTGSLGQALIAVEHVLDGVEGRVADERLGVDHQPWLALGGEDVPGVQIGAQQDPLIGGARVAPGVLAIPSRASPGSTPRLSVA